MIVFDEEYLSRTKSLAVKNDTKINLTTRFLNGKVLMFSKTSIQSFVYDLIDIFMFPTDDVKEIQKCFLYQNLTDTNSTSLFFWIYLRCFVKPKWKNIERHNFSSISSIKSIK